MNEEFAESINSGVDAGEEGASAYESSESDSVDAASDGATSVDMETAENTETEESEEISQTVSSFPFSEYALLVPADSLPALPFVQPDQAEVLSDSPEPQEETTADTVDTLVDILAHVLISEQDVSPEQDSEQQSSEAVTGESLPEALREPVPAAASDDTAMESVLEHLEKIQTQISPHPMLTTPFEDYTVCEGLLLLLLLFVVVSFCVKMLRRAFSWLLW